MVVVLDTISATPLRPRHPEKVNRPDALSPPKPDWIRVRAPNSARLCRHPQDRQGKRPRHGVRGGRLPEYRRVLGQEARHLHDHGRHLHPRLRLLQRQDRHARRARRRRAGACRARRPPSSGSPMSSSPRSTATISPTAAPSISPRPSAPSARAARRPRSRS